jgi:hypothetical protein
MPGNTYPNTEDVVGSNRILSAQLINHRFDAVNCSVLTSDFRTGLNFGDNFKLRAYQDTGDFRSAKINTDARFHLDPPSENGCSPKTM